VGVVPAYIQALAWNDILLGFPTRISGEVSTGWVLVMSSLPIGIGMAFLSFATVNRSLVDAARLWHSDQDVLWKVVIPLAGPLLAAGWVFIFLIHLMDYSVPSLFGVTVYSLDIFAEFSATHQAERALLISIPIIALSILLIPVLNRAFRFSTHSQPAEQSSWGSQPAWPPTLLFLQRAALGLWAVQFGVPVFRLVWLSMQSASGGEMMTGASQDLGFSFVVAAAAALLSLPLSVWFLQAARSRHSFPWLAALPLALPAPLVGAGLAASLNLPVLQGFYNSAWMPVLAGLVRFIPLAVIAISAQEQRIDPLLLDALNVYQKKPWRGSLLVRLPLLTPGLIGAAGLVFALTLGELGATLIVIPPGQSTLSLRIFNYLHYGASEMVARLCLIVLGSTLAAGTITSLALNAVKQKTEIR